MLFLSKSLKLLVYLLSPIIITIILIFSIFKKIRFCILPAHRIGEIAGLTALYIYEKKNKKKNKNLDIFFLTHIVSNKFLVNLLKKYILILPHLFVQPIFKTIKTMSNFIPYLKKFYFTLSWIDKNFLISKSKKIKLDKNYVIKGENFLKRIGVPKNSKIACLIVRDKNYLKDLLPDENFGYHDYRNCNIDNYKKTIMYLISKNYYVFRMGVNYKKELKIKNTKYIDYSKNYRSDFLDIYLAYRCNLVISSDTGWDIVPTYFFKKPILYTNLAPYQGCKPYLRSSVFLTKSYYNIKTKKKISPWIVNKIINQPFDGREYKKRGISLKENKPNEIKDAAIQILNFIEKKNNNFKKRDNEISLKMWKKFNQNINNESEIFNKNKFPKGNFSINFLKSNKKILKIDV